MIQYILPVNIHHFLAPFIQDPNQMESIVAKFKDAVGPQSALKKKMFGTKMAYTLNLNIGRYYHRVVFEKAVVDGVDSYVLRGFAWVHDYRAALQWQPLGCVTLDDVRKVYGSDVVTLDGCSSIEHDVSEKMIFSKTNWYEPTVLQTEIMTCDQFPQLMVGPPGSGKSLIAMGLLQEQALRHIENNQPGVLKLLLMSNSPRLVLQAKATFSAWEKINLPLGPNRIIVRFLTVDEYNIGYAETCNLSLLNEEARLAIVKIYFPSRDDYEKILVELYNNAWRLTQDAIDHNPWPKSLYKETGARHSLYSEEERSFLYPSFLTMIDDLQTKILREGKNPYFPGLSVITTDDERFLYDLVILDEVQNMPVQIALSMYRFSKNGQIVFIGDTLQKGKRIFSTLAELEPAVYSLFHRSLQILKLSKTLRLLPGVANVANNIVKLYTSLNKGRADSLSYTEIAVPDGDDSSNKNSVTRLSFTEKESLKQIGADPLAAVIVLREEDKAEAGILINGSNVFTYNEAQGLDFSQVLLYLSEDTLEQFIPLAMRMNKRQITAETALMDYPHLSAEKSNEDQRPNTLLSNLLVAVSRGYGLLTVYWEPISESMQHKLNPFIPWLRQTLGEEKKPVVIKARENTPEDWLNVIHRFVEEGAISQANGNLRHIFLLNEEEAESYIVCCQNRQPAASSAALISWVKKTRLAAQAAVAPLPQAIHPKKQPVISSNPEVIVPLAIAPVLPLSPEVIVPIVPSAEINMAFSPLSAKLSGWVEDLYCQINNANNVKALLDHNKALPILFHHPMKNGHCLWINLAINNQLETFLNHAKKNKKEVISLIQKGFEIAQKSQNALLIFCFAVEEEKLISLFTKSDIVSLQWLKHEKHEKIPGIIVHNNQSVDSKGKLLIYFTQSKYFSVKHMDFLTSKTIIKGQKIDYSILHVLVMESHDFSNENRAFLREIAKYLAPYFSETPEGCDHSFLWRMLASVSPKRDSVDLLIQMLSPLTKYQRGQILFNATPQGIGPIHLSIFYFLYHEISDLELTRNHWSYLSELIESNMNVFFEQEFADQGTHFHVLCFDTRGARLLSYLWPFFSPILSKNPAYLFSPITAKGKNKGKTPFCSLCTPIPGNHVDGAGRLIIGFHLDRRFYSGINLIDKNPRIGIQSLHLLFRNALIMDFFSDDFMKINPEIKNLQTLIQNHASLLIEQVTESGEEQGANFLYYLCSTEKGRRVLNELWDFWEPIILQNASGLFSPITGDGEHQDKTALLHLCTNEDGRKILYDHYNFFEEVIFANIEMPFAGIKHRDAITHFEDMFKNQMFSEEIPLHFMLKKLDQMRPSYEKPDPPLSPLNLNSFFTEDIHEEARQSPLSERRTPQ